MVKIVGHMMYLTPNERHVWRAILAQAEEVGERHRIGLPEDRSKTCSKLGIKASYLSTCVPMVSRLIESHSIVCISRTNKHKMETYEFSSDPNQIKIINTKVRLTKKCSPELLRAINAVEKGDFEEPIIPWIKTQGITSLTPISVNAKLYRYYPNRTSDGWGIIKYEQGSKGYFLCVTGFERFRFVTSTRATPGKRLSGIGKRRKTKKVSAKKKAPAIPDPKDTLSTAHIMKTLEQLSDNKLCLVGIKQDELITLGLFLKTWSDSVQEEVERREEIEKINKRLAEIEKIENEKRALLDKRKSLKK